MKIMKWGAILRFIFDGLAITSLTGLVIIFLFYSVGMPPTEISSFFFFFPFIVFQWSMLIIGIYYTYIKKISWGWVISIFALGMIFSFIFYITKFREELNSDVTIMNKIGLIGLIVGLVMVSVPWIIITII